MHMGVWHLLGQELVDERVVSSWHAHARVHPALLVLFCLGAGLLAIYLYRGQRRIASSRIVGVLTVLRVALIFLICLALLGPVRQFTRTGRTNGTLWLLLDQSASMNQADAQATPREKLRLA